jgi:predicted transcriptional regulator
MNTKTKRQETIFKSFANEHRINILKLLRKEKNAPVWYISQRIEAPFTTTSRHLHILLDAKILVYEQNLNEIVYSLYSKNSRLVNYMIKNL